MTGDRVVGLLGGGQLGRMLLESANRNNIQVNVLDAPQAPAKQISSHNLHIDGSFANADAIRKLAKTCQVLTIEIEHVDTLALEQVESETAIDIQPSWKTIRVIQDKLQQKKHLQARNIAVGPFKSVPQHATSEDLQHVATDYGYPYMLKSRTHAYDGRGNFPVRTQADCVQAAELLHDRQLYAEQWQPFKKELAVMVVKTSSGLLSYPTVETVHEDSICKLVYAPARGVSATVNAAAQALARQAVGTFEGKGVFGVEMFLLPDDTLLINEIAPRPHNSGHYTIEACPISQYEAHLRAILDLPIPETSLRLREPAIMLNILGGSSSTSHLELASEARSIPNASLHLYAKGDGRPARKMGHVTLTAPSLALAQYQIAPLIVLADRIRARRLDIHETIATQPASHPPPEILVTMGSDSDLPTLKPGLALLHDYFHIPTEVRVTSAHRTPGLMASVARSAASRSIRVIIAAAGGAAHLPGMVAAHTTLPVIGVPVRGSVLDGNDSLLSIVQMPRGVPVATVGIGNSINAALLAARIIASGGDDRVRTLVEQYIDNAEHEVLAKDERLMTIGWKEYAEAMGKK